MRETKFGMIQSPLQADMDRIADEIVEYLNADMAFLSVTHNSVMVSLGLSSTAKSAGSSRTHMPADMVCLQTMQTDMPLALRDARDDPFASQTRYVREGIVAGYIGVPIQSAEIGAIGSICGVTQTPRDWSDADLRYLKAISENVENLILREMYRLESLDATSLASEYDQIIAAFALVRAEATAIHDGTGRLVFANRTLTDQVEDIELESTRFKSVLLATPGEGPVDYRAASGVDFVLTRLRTGSGYIVSQWKPVISRLN